MWQWLKWKIAGQELHELHRWRVKWQEYRRWLAENQDVAEALDSLRAEAVGEQLNACLPPHGDGPWTVQGVRMRMRDRSGYQPHHGPTPQNPPPKKP